VKGGDNRPLSYLLIICLMDTSFYIFFMKKILD